MGWTQETSEVVEFLLKVLVEIDAPERKVFPDAKSSQNIPKTV